jgi:hypothetical protein
MIEIAIALLVFYLAYRSIRGGFERPQSERLGCFGVFGITILVIVFLLWAASWIERTFF